MLGIFPLGLVIFPESVIQLHIFEQKYKNLINDCLDKDSQFGVNIILASKIQKVGCLVKIVEILKRYPDDKMDILVRGISKYLITSQKVSNREYLEANVEFLEDKPEYPDSTMIEDCVNLYNSIAKEIKSLKLDTIDSSIFFTLSPSYFFAQKAGLTNEQKYYLLQLNSEKDRLKFIYDHLSQIEPYLRETEIIERIIKSDGYGKAF